MASLNYTKYYSASEALALNEYICDGHGEPEHKDVCEKVNKYICDGHGLTTELRGVNCPADPVLATQKMVIAEELYHHLNGSEKGHGRPVMMYQFYFSLTEEDSPKVSNREMMDMTDELILEAGLDEFDCLHGVHNNTPNKHSHISVGAYAIDGSKKLCMNNKELYRLRFCADKVAARHGLSIIEPEPLAFYHWPEYKEWYDKVLQEQKNKIIERDKTSRKHKTRNQKYKEAMERELRQQKEKQEKNKEKRLVLFYASSTGKKQYDTYWRSRQYVYYKSKYATDQHGRQMVVRIPKEDASVLKLSLKLAMTICGKYDSDFGLNEPDEYDTSDSIYFGKIDYKAQRAYDGLRAADRMNINNHEKLYERRRTTGNKISTLRQEIKYNEAKYNDRHDLREAYNEYAYIANTRIANGGMITERENELRWYLESQGVVTYDDQWALLDRDGLTISRIENLKQQLADAEKDYRDIMHLIRVTEKMNYETILAPYREQRQRERQKESGLDGMISGAKKRYDCNIEHNDRKPNIVRRMDDFVRG